MTMFSYLHCPEQRLPQNACGMPACRLYLITAILPVRRAWTVLGADRGMGLMATGYDVVVVGAGMGGLVCGNLLARGGKKVLMIEQNHQPGGLMAGIKRKGFYFDAGDQSIENMGITFPILKLLGLHDPDDWERARYRLIMGETDQVLSDLNETAEVMAAAYPGEEKGIREYFAMVDRVSRFIAELTKDGNVPLTARGPGAIVGFVRASWAGLKNLKLALGLLPVTIGEMASEYIEDPGVKRFASGLGYKNMCGVLGTGFWHMWTKDYWYPKNGIQSLMDSLADGFRSCGGELRLRALVEEIIIEDGRAAGVRTADDEKISAGKVVYCGDMNRLYTKLIPTSLSSHNFLRKITTAPLAEPLITAFLGLDIPADELREILKVHHTFYLPEHGDKNMSDVDDPDLHRDTWFEVNAPCISNPRLVPEGHSAVTVQTITNFNWMNRWGTGGRLEVRNEEYARLKEKVLDDMIYNLEKVIPGVRGRIVYSEIGTPLSTHRFTLNKDGGSCAFSFDPRVSPFVKRPMQFRTPVRGLYMAGHWSLWPGGIVGAMYSGRVVAHHILTGFYSELTDRVYQYVRRYLLKE